MDETKHLDVLIVGAGMAGATLAIALKDSGLSVGLVDRFVPNSDTPPPSFDDRSTALSHNTVGYLQCLGVWNNSLVSESGGIKHIHVSDAGHWGKTRLHANKHGIDAFGYVVENRLLGAALAQGLAACGNLQQFTPAELVNVSPTQSGVQVSLKQDQGERQLNAKLVVAADGANSTIRQLLNTPAQTHDYQQTAIIANLAMDKAHEGWAFERFASDGPMAVLPLSQQRCALVWTQSHQAAQELLALDDEAFAQRFLERFGYRLGNVQKVGERASYPLSRVMYTPSNVPGVVFVGNAANALHPVAGQGFNLGIRDVQALVAQLHSTTFDLGSLKWVQQFESKRALDQQVTVGASHGLISLFGTKLLPAISARNVGLFALDRCSVMKESFVTQAMGYSVYER